jgi:exonuclease III
MHFKTHVPNSFVLLAFCCLPFIGFTQNPQAEDKGVRVMFYNVENLFHPTDDSLKNDDEFTLEGMRHWTFARYQDKLNKVAKTIIAVGEWNPPAVVGLCEIESIQCLYDLVLNTPLAKFGYQVLLIESDDNRGIDVGLIYRPQYFELLEHHAVKLNFPEENARPSRDILYVKGKIKKDTVHFYVNHWPSRYGGVLATVPKRNFAAHVLRAHIDSIRTANAKAKIVAMGDFNDHPNDESMLDILGAKNQLKDSIGNDLVNLMFPFTHVKGTHKYQHEWSILDQFVTTLATLDSSSGLFTKPEAVRIFQPDFLLEMDSDGLGQKPKRTYIGYRYHGGFSDHLPIYLDIYAPGKN